jgi:hypothetical protein
LLRVGSRKRFIETGGDVLVLARGRGKGRTSGVEFDQSVAYVCSLRERKVTRLWIFQDPKRALEAVGLGEEGQRGARGAQYVIGRHVISVAPSTCPRAASRQARYETGFFALGFTTHAHQARLIWEGGLSKVSDLICAATEGRSRRRLAVLLETRRCQWDGYAGHSG